MLECEADTKSSAYTNVSTAAHTGKERNSIDENLCQRICVPQSEGLVSVVLPVYNGGEILEESIKSVLSQRYKNLELIIVNDGSTDQSLEIARRFAQNDTRVKIINQENKKLPTALSAGFREAKGEFLTWTSADNVMLPRCIEVLAENLKRKPETAMVYGNMRLINKDGNIKRGHRLKARSQYLHRYRIWLLANA